MRVIRCFLDTDIRMGHPGLTLLAKKEKIVMSELGHGEFVIFVNRARNKVKVFAPGNVLAYLRLERGTLDLRAIQEIPKVFGAKGKIDLDQATRTVLEKKLGKGLRVVDLVKAV